MPIVLLILCFSIALFFVDLGELNIKINSVNFNSDTLFSKTLLVISALNYLLIIAALYFFRKILNYFIRVKIFEDGKSRKNICGTAKERGTPLIFSPWTDNPATNLFAIPSCSHKRKIKKQ